MRRGLPTSCFWRMFLAPATQHVDNPWKGDYYRDKNSLVVIIRVINLRLLYRGIIYGFVLNLYYCVETWILIVVRLGE